MSSCQQNIEQTLFTDVCPVSDKKRLEPTEYSQPQNQSVLMIFVIIITRLLDEKSVTKITIFCSETFFVVVFLSIISTRKHPQQTHTSISALLGLNMALEQHESFKPYILVLLVD